MLYVHEMSLNTNGCVKLLKSGAPITRSLSVAIISKQFSSDPKDGVAIYLHYITTDLSKHGIRVYKIWPVSYTHLTLPTN